MRGEEEEKVGVIKFTNESDQASDESTPWLTEHTRNIHNPILRFHNEVIDFAAYVSPSEQEHTRKMEVYSIIRSVVVEMAPDAQLISPLF